MTTSAAENRRGGIKRGGEAAGAGARAGVAAAGAACVPGAPGQSGGAAGKQQVPFDSASPERRGSAEGRHAVRSDMTSRSVNDSAVRHAAAGEAFEGTIRAVVDEAVEAVAEAPAPHTPPPHTAAATAELRSAGQPGAAVPTLEASEDAAASEPITIYAQAESRMPANLVVNLEIADIDKNPFQTRYVADDEALEELADSIKANGVVQPIMVRPGDEEGRYILVLGERRLLASKKAGKTTIPAMVRRVSLQQAAEMTIIENLQREDLSALEQAEAFRVLSKEFSLTQAQIGERVGLSRESVSNYMRLLKLPREVMQLLAEKRITFCGGERVAEAGERRSDYARRVVCGEEGADVWSRSREWSCR